MIYDPNHCAVFFKTREKFGELSNMASGFPIKWGEQIVHSSEALYQAHKFDRSIVVDGVSPFDTIISERSPFISKKKAQHFSEYMRWDWHEVKLDVMDYCLRLKYSQHKKRLDRVLDATKDLPIVEKSRSDRTWGAVNDYKGNLEGLNLLGQLWEIIRAERPSLT